MINLIVFKFYIYIFSEFKKYKAKKLKKINKQLKHVSILEYEF